MTNSGGARRQFIVCGDGPLAFRVTLALSTRYEGDVTVILPYAESKYGARMAALNPDHIRVVEFTRPDAEALDTAGIDTADAVALLDQDDGGNIETALLVHEMRPGLRLVVRFFDDELGAGVAQHLPNCDVLSASKIAAPQLVALALGEARPVEVPGLNLVVATPDQRRGADLLPLAALDDAGEPIMLPSDGQRAQFLLSDSAPPADGPAPELPRANGRLWKYLRQNLNRYVWYAIGALGALVLVGATLVAVIEHVSFWTALYRMFLNVLVGSDPVPEAGLTSQVVQMLLTVVSVAVIPLLTAALVDAAIRARLTATNSGPGTDMTGHVVVVGLGDVGTRVLATLLRRGIPVVVVELDENARGVPFAREQHVPVVIGDARRAETLRAAYVGGARAIMCLTSNDVTNIGITIAARGIDRPDGAGPLRPLLRMFEEDFARRVQGIIPGSESRSASALSAPAFAASVMGPEVLDTVPFRDRVLLVAEVPMHAHAELESRPSVEVNVPGEVHLLALRLPRKHFGSDVVHDPSAGFPLHHNYHLIVIATRTGLERLQARTAPNDQGGPDGPGSD
ncbi:NAD-binding protein [Promicromonospora soli]